MDIKTKILTFVKLGLVMLVAFLASGLVNQEIFINNSPALRPNLGPYLLARAQGITSSGGSMFAFLIPGKKQEKELSNHFAEVLQNRLKDVPLKAVSKGVYAKEDDQVAYTEVHIDEMDWRIYTVNINGKDVTIKMPADKARLSPQQVQQLVQ